MSSVPADFVSTRAPAVPAMTAVNAAKTARRIAMRFFRPSMCLLQRSSCDRSDLWQRNHIPARRSTDLYALRHLRRPKPSEVVRALNLDAFSATRAGEAAQNQPRLEHLGGAPARGVLEAAQQQERGAPPHLER